MQIWPETCRVPCFRDRTCRDGARSHSAAKACRPGTKSCFRGKSQEDHEPWRSAPKAWHPTTIASNCRPFGPDPISGLT
jgi:hypothetical protein